MKKFTLKSLLLSSLSLLSSISSLSTEDLLVSVLLLLSLLSRWLLNLVGKTSSHQSVMRLKLLSVGNTVVNQSETGWFTSTVLGSESENRDAILLRLVQVSQLLLQLSLWNICLGWMDNIDNKLSSLQQWVADDLSGPDSNSVRLYKWINVSKFVPAESFHRIINRSFVIAFSSTFSIHR